MAFREVDVIEVREILRAWLLGKGQRSVARQAGVDRKTVVRYVDAALEAGLVRDGGQEQLTDELIGQVVAALRPDRPNGHGVAWESLEAQRDQIAKWVGDGLTVVKIGDLLGRQGVVVPQRTLHRFCVERTDYQGRGRRATVPVADGEPGEECDPAVHPGPLRCDLQRLVAVGADRQRHDHRRGDPGLMGHQRGQQLQEAGGLGSGVGVEQFLGLIHRQDQCVTRSHPI